MGLILHPLRNQWQTTERGKMASSTTLVNPIEHAAWKCDLWEEIGTLEAAVIRPQSTSTINRRRRESRLPLTPGHIGISANRLGFKIT